MKLRPEHAGRKPRDRHRPETSLVRATDANEWISTFVQCEYIHPEREEALLPGKPGSANASGNDNDLNSRLTCSVGRRRLVARDRLHGGAGKDIEWRQGA